MTFHKGGTYQQVASPAQIALWRSAIGDGRRRVADAERRATYPQNADPETVALCERYKIKYWQGRILKALSFFVDVTADELCDLVGIHRALIKMEVHQVSRRTGMQIFVVSKPGHVPAVFRLINARDRDEIRSVIAESWGLDVDQSRVRLRA